MRVIRCRVAAATARTRIAARPEAGRAAHRGDPIAADGWLPISLDIPTLTVDTTGGYAPTEAEIVAFTATSP
jgi:hypothetical protein